MGYPASRKYDANKRLRTFIDENAKAPSKVADKAGIRRDTFSHILGSRRPIYADEIIDICQAVGCSPQYLLGIEESG